MSELIKPRHKGRPCSNDLAHLIVHFGIVGEDGLTGYSLEIDSSPVIVHNYFSGIIMRLSRCFSYRGVGKSILWFRRRRLLRLLLLLFFLRLKKGNKS